jgi:Zn-dependent M28 family amino/carboxypeptidase
MMMEAMRILQAIKLKPARTIRIGLWSGEEEGLLGSRAYVQEHLGSFENPKPDFSRVRYFNIDSGAGSVRPVIVFGPELEQTMLRETIAPFADLGVDGSSAFLSRVLGSTDSFSQAGISTIDLMQRPIDYDQPIWTRSSMQRRRIWSRVQRSSLRRFGALLAAQHPCRCLINPICRLRRRSSRLTQVLRRLAFDWMK